jgi:hypothetical protein
MFVLLCIIITYLPAEMFMSRHRTECELNFIRSLSLLSLPPNKLRDGSGGGALFFFVSPLDSGKCLVVKGNMEMGMVLARTGAVVQTIPVNGSLI